MGLSVPKVMLMTEQEYSLQFALYNWMFSTPALADGWPDLYMGYMNYDCCLWSALVWQF